MLLLLLVLLLLSLFVFRGIRRIVPGHRRLQPWCRGTTTASTNDMGMSHNDQCNEAHILMKHVVVGVIAGILLLFPLRGSSRIVSAYRRLQPRCRVTTTASTNALSLSYLFQPCLGSTPIDETGAEIYSASDGVA